jgi:sugar lactone lactonase YvrE
MNVERRRASPATGPDYALAESPVWDASRSLLHWVDIPAGAVLAGRLQGGRIREVGRWTLDETVGAVALAEAGGLLVAGRHALHTLDPDGVWHPGPPLISGPRRFNDGACDPYGRFVVGSLDLSGRGGREQQLLTSLGGDRSRVVRSGIGLSNGIDWNADGTAIYHVDSDARTVSRAAYDVASGLATDWVTLFEVPDGTPDGLAVDAAGDLWLAVWGAGEVRRYTHAGEITHVVEVDAPLTSSLAFAGDELDTLVITTAREGLTPSELERFPESGALFTCTVDARGRLPTRWRG